MSFGCIVALPPHSWESSNMDLQKVKASCLCYCIIVSIPDIIISSNINVDEHLCSVRGAQALILCHLPVLSSYPHSSDKIVTWTPKYTRLTVLDTIL